MDDKTLFTVLHSHVILLRIVYAFPAVMNTTKPEQHRTIPLKISYEPKLTAPFLIHILFNPIKDVENRETDPNKLAESTIEFDTLYSIVALTLISIVVNKKIFSHLENLIIELKDSQVISVA